MNGRNCRLPRLGTEPPAVFGFDGSVGPDFDGEDEVAGGARVAELAFAGEELTELLHQHLGYLDLGFAFGGVGDDDTVFISPRGHHTLAKRIFENREGRTGCFSPAIHGELVSPRIAESRSKLHGL